MKGISNKITAVLAAAALAGNLTLSVLPAFAAEANAVPASDMEGWAVTELAFEAGGWTVESLKSDRDFVVWTRLGPGGQRRELWAFDGAKTTRLADMAAEEWDRDAGNGFFDHITGNYDLADGLAVWTASDGLDREIWSFDGFRSVQVSSNTYDDWHPVTARGRIAWTSYPSVNYSLMLKDRRGTQRLDGWQVLNYAFSGPNLYWLNRLPNEDWFRVFREDGRSVVPVGKGDDRQTDRYFLTDGTGTAAWEYSTKKWDYDKREVFLSYLGREAYRVIQRDVPPTITQLEDIVGYSVILNTTDLMRAEIWNRVQLISAGFTESYLYSHTAAAKVRHYGNGLLVRHMVPETASALLIGNGSASSEIVLNRHVIHNRFEAADGLLAGALLGGGLLLRTDRGTDVIPTGGEVRSLAAGAGCVAWLEGEEGSGRLRSACPSVAVRHSNGRAYRVSGRLIKTADSPHVYLAAADGFRYHFPSETQFYGWYGDFASVRTVSPTEMHAIPLSGTVLMRPGYRPIRIEGDSRVYAVTGDGELRWAVSEEVMSALDGEGWNVRVAAMPVHSLADYRIGAPIGDIQSAQKLRSEYRR